MGGHGAVDGAARNRAADRADGHTE
jgi:hypothetical protein